MAGALVLGTVGIGADAGGGGAFALDGQEEKRG